MNASESIKESVRKSGGLEVPPDMTPPQEAPFPVEIREAIEKRVSVHVPGDHRMEEVLVCMAEIYRQARTWGTDLSEDDRETICKFGKLLEKASDLWWSSPALQRLAPGGSAGSPIHVLEQGIDAVAWVAGAYRPKLEQKRTVIRKILFHWTGIGLPLPISAITDKVKGTRSPAYILCGIMLEAVFGEPPGDFSSVYEPITRKMSKN